MIPTHCTGAISPVKIKVEVIVGECKDVPSKVTTEVKVILLTEFEVHLSIQIIEAVGGDWTKIGVIPVCSIHSIGYQVNVGSTSAYYEGAFVLFYGSLQGEP